MTNNNTHVATTPNKKPATPLEEVKVMMNSKEYTKQITNYYRGNKEEAMAFLTASVEHIRKMPKLLDCDKMSLLTALVTSAQFRFMPSGVSGEGYIIPYGREAKFQIGYQGLLTLLYRTEKIKSIKAVVVYKNDKFQYAEGINPTLMHVPTPWGEDQGKAIGVYAVADTTNGGHVFNVMSEKQVMAIKAMSKAKATASSPWNSKDPEKWMWKKTCLIQLAKLLPKTQDLRRAIEIDYKGEGLDKPELDAGGPAVGAALHSPEDESTKEKTNDQEEPEVEDSDPDTGWMADIGHAPEEGK